MCSRSNNCLCSGDEARDIAAKRRGKKARKWGEDGAYEADENEILDFSSAHESLAKPRPEAVDRTTSTQNKLFEIHDDEDDDDDVDVSVEGKGNRGWGIFSNFVGGKVLTKEDLKEPLEQMHQFLLAKNVASEVSLHLCESVETSLIGQKTGNWQSNWTLKPTQTD